MIYSQKQLQSDFAPYGPELHHRSQTVMSRQGTKAQALLRHIGRLPAIRPSKVLLDQERIVIGQRGDLTSSQADRLNHALRALKPWRKGPYDLFGTAIDSEWNSSLKWKRVAPHIAPLSDHRVLDVGSSNGYYLFRMAAAQPRTILGIEPYFAYYAQFLALFKYLDLDSVYCLPLKLEELPPMTGWFETIFCMGILYHQRSPLAALSRIKSMLAPGGQLILETLIIDGAQDTALCPRDRYACMRNVFFIPTVPCLENWLSRSGFADIRCVDITRTTEREQRKTAWIASDSLDAFLDPTNTRRTREGYPAPIRAVVVATRA